MNNHDLENIVTSPTRTAVRTNGSSSTLIDVTLCNNKCKVDFLVTDCVFSDHKFVSLAFPFIRVGQSCTFSPLRNLNVKNMEAIITTINNTEF